MFGTFELGHLEWMFFLIPHKQISSQLRQETGAHLTSDCSHGRNSCSQKAPALKVMFQAFCSVWRCVTTTCSGPLRPSDSFFIAVVPVKMCHAFLLSFGFLHRAARFRRSEEGPEPSVTSCPNSGFT